MTGWNSGGKILAMTVLMRVLLALVVGLPTARLMPAQSVPAGEVRYGRDVRPILADRCFRCHGPDAASREAKLRLDEREFAVAVRADGKQAIVPGDVAQSLVWQRLTHPDEQHRMPPVASGKPRLSAAELDVVERWIRGGAEYEPHWAFVPPRKAVALPASTHPVDHFLASRLRQHGLEPSPLAEPATLLRRLFLVLTGLPPTLAELREFAADPSPAAYERWVDRLLGEEPYRTRHAEHLGSLWLDAARYADTSGIHMDAGRQIWPWRDWLLAALRDDMPFGQFVTEQLAGDLLPAATLAQRTATGFLRNHVTTDEGGAIDEEYRVEYAAERASTVGSVFLGLTIGCARCHDHKYDPIRQEDYYRLFAFFNQNDEPGLYSQVPDANRALEPFLRVPRPEQVAEQQRLTEAIAAATAALAAVSPAELLQRDEFVASLRQPGQLAYLPTTLLAASSSAGSILEAQADGSVLATGAAPAKERLQFDLRVDGSGLQLLCLEALPDASLPGGKAGRAPNGNAVLRWLEVLARPAGSEADWVPVPLQWAAAEHEQDDGDYRVTNALWDDARGYAIGAHQRAAGPVRALFLAAAPFGDAAGTEVRVVLHHDTQYAQHAFGRVRLQWASIGQSLLARLPVARGAFHVAGPFAASGARALYDTAFGPEHVERLLAGPQWGKLGWRHDRNLREGVASSALPAGSNATYVAQEVLAPTARSQPLSLGSDDGFQLYRNGERVAAREVDRGVAPDQDQAEVELPAGRSLLVQKIVNTGGAGGFYLQYRERDDELADDLRWLLLPAASVDAGLQQRIDAAWRRRFSPDYLARQQRLTGLQQQLAQLERSVPRTMVMQDAAMPRQTYLLQRGEYDKPDRSRPLQPGIPQVFGALPVADKASRLDLARWLTSAEQPLLWRVHVNRIWQFVFGTGLVRTSEDFGLQGEWPSHEELLDHLAVWFRDEGQSTQQLLRLLVTSHAFRQQSRVATAAQQVDADNRWLGWFPRRRLPAEAIRDQSLFLGGLLVERFGGPSVKPLQPDGLWEEVAMLQSNTRVYRRGDGEDLWRRSLYTYWKRACPPPALLVLDAPTREFCTVRRSVTNTPLQALALWNDESMVAAARGFAAAALAAVPERAERVRWLYERATGRLPSELALTAGLALLQQLQARFDADPAAATLLSNRQPGQPAAVPAAEHAAYTLLASSLLHHDATLCIE